MSEILVTEGRRTRWQRFKYRCRQTLGILSWIIPFVIMFLSWLLFGALSDIVSLPWNARPEVALGLLFELALTAGWVIFEIYYATSRETTVRQLQVDSVVSTGFALLFTFFGAMMIITQILPWWYLFPWIGAIVDAIGSGVVAINNAAQKPLIQQDNR